jgi:hypothetical protein
VDPRAAPAVLGHPQRRRGLGLSLTAPPPQSLHTAPSRLEGEAAADPVSERIALGCRLSCFGPLCRSNRRARIGDFRFKRANRLAEQGDRSRFALGKVSLCFLSHPLVVTSPAADRAQNGALQRCTCDKRTDVEPRGKVKAKVRRRAIPECRRQSLLNARFERHDFGDANSPPHFRGIKILEALDAYLKSLDIGLPEIRLKIVSLYSGLPTLAWKLCQRGYLWTSTPSVRR